MALITDTLQVYEVPPGGHSDPLAQKHVLSWKADCQEGHAHGGIHEMSSSRVSILPELRAMLREVAEAERDCMNRLYV